MKKFKTTREKHLAKENDLAHLLAERHLLRSVFLDFVHLPPTLWVGFSGMLIAYLAQLDGLNIFLSFYLGAGGMCFYFIFHQWSAFHKQKQNFSHTLNAYAGQKRYPILFALSFLFLLAPLAWVPKAIGFGGFLLACVAPTLIQAQHKKVLSYGLSTLMGLTLMALPLLMSSSSFSSPAMFTYLGLGLSFLLIHFLRPALFFPSEKQS